MFVLVASDSCRLMDSYQCLKTLDGGGVREATSLLRPLCSLARSERIGDTLQAMLVPLTS